MKQTYFNNKQDSIFDAAYNVLTEAHLNEKESIKPEDIVAVIFGDFDRKTARGLSGLGNKLIDLSTYNPKTGAPRYNDITITKELIKLGISSTEANIIRSITRTTAKEVRDIIEAKYMETDEFMKTKEYQSNRDDSLHSGNSFQKYKVFSFYNEWEPMLEFNKLFRETLLKKLS